MNVTNPELIVPKVVISIHNVRAVKHAQLVNVEINVIQETVQKVNYVKMEPVSLVAEITWIVQAIDPV